MALQRILGEMSGYEIQVMYTDDGVVLRFADVEELPGADVLVPDPDDLEDLVTDQLAGTSLFAGLFRENAVRSLLLRRRRPGQRSPLWAQRLKAQNLLATVRQYPSFPIVMETYRQAMADVFDLPGLKALLTDIRSRAIAIDDVETRSASPFAKSLVFAYVAAYLYEQDAPLAERKAQALTLDRSLLRELLGQSELRELIDAEVLAELEDELQFLAEERHARDADEVHDLLRRLGDLTTDEIALRASEAPISWLESLKDQRRAVELKVAGEKRWIAAEDAGLYRDALGCATPPGVPDTFLVPVERPLETLLRRWARHHGPFLAADPAARFDLRVEQVTEVLQRLEASGVLDYGEIRPGGVQPDWCDAEVLRRLKRRNLARLRDEVAAVDTPALALFLPAWHGIGGRGSGPERLTEVISQLQDYPLPWSLLNTVLLPARVPGYRPEMLDTLAASGTLVWVGRGAAGSKDGRISLYLREEVRELLDEPGAFESDSRLHTVILDSLKSNGASFMLEIAEAVKTANVEHNARELTAALWDLVWAGQITNDTFAPLRDLSRSGPRRSRHASGRGAVVTGGRWSLVRGLAGKSDDTRRSLARAKLLLNRYGVVSRKCAQHEELPGGFAPLYKVYREMEEQGRVRRGHFVDGLEGAQFAWAGAVDRLRGLREDADERDRPITVDDIRILAATDPANPYGGIVPWPSVANAEKAKPRRVAGAWLLLARGRPVIYAARRGRQLITFPATLRDHEDAFESAVRALRHLPRGTARGMLVIEKIDGIAVNESPLLGALKGLGFANDYRGLIDLGEETDTPRSTGSDSA